MKTAVIIPTTSKGRDWKYPRHSYLFKTLGSIKETTSNHFNLKVYVGIDEDDLFYTDECIDFFKIFDIPIEFIKVNVPKGHVTKIWNILAQKACGDGYEYIYMCGDDITFQTKGWLDGSIQKLQENNNIGMTGPRNTNGNTRILTQCLVHRKHLDIFGFFFPEEIKNWYCDDWINDVYPRLRIDDKYTCFNSGGEPRYVIEHAKDLCEKLVERDKQILQKYKNENTS